jgi:hypothetical protein
MQICMNNATLNQSTSKLFVEQFPICMHMFCSHDNNLKRLVEIGMDFQVNCRCENIAHYVKYKHVIFAMFKDYLSNHIMVIQILT